MSLYVTLIHNKRRTAILSMLRHHETTDKDVVKQARKYHTEYGKSYSDIHVFRMMPDAHNGICDGQYVYENGIQVFPEDDY